MLNLLKKTIKKMFEYIYITIMTIYSFIIVILRSKFIKFDKTEKSNLYVLGSGPSLGYTLENKIEKLKKEKKNALRNYNAEDMDREEYLELKAEIEEELNLLEEQKQKIEDNKENDKVTKYKKAIPILANCLSEYHNLTISERNELLKTIIEKVIYKKSEKERWKRENNFDLEIFLRI